MQTCITNLCVHKKLLMSHKEGLDNKNSDLAFAKLVGGPSLSEDVSRPVPQAVLNWWLSHCSGHVLTRAFQPYGDSPAPCIQACQDVLKAHLGAQDGFGAAASRWMAQETPKCGWAKRSPRKC